MSDKVMRHLIAALATLITGLAFYSGYVAGTRGWWWVVFSILIIYGVVYKIIDVN